MGAKSKKRKGKPSQASQNPLEEAQRQFSRRNFREALKEARRVHRQQPSEATRDFLQVATLARVRDMQQHGLRDEARELAANLLEMGVTDPGVKQELPSVLATLGMLDRAMGEGAAIEADSAVMKAAADHAVMHPEEVPRSLPQIGEETLLVRSALEAVEAGRDDEALDKLKPIGRSSPLSDWRLFVRGLIAYYRGEDEAMRAAWERLEAGRLAARIAAQLRAVAEPGIGEEDGFRNAAFLTVEKAVLGGALLGDLIELQRLAGAGNWKSCATVLRRLRTPLERLDPTLWREVRSFVYRALVMRAGLADLRQLKQWLDPPEMDPNWHRAAAMILEREEGVEEAEDSWRLFLADLDGVAEFSPDERKLARALVHRHLGEVWLCESTPSDGGFFDTEDEAPDEEGLGKAIGHFKSAIQAVPDYAPGYRGLAEAYRNAGRRRDAARTLEKLLGHHPDDLESLVVLACDYQKEDDPLKAWPHLQRAANLKPLDRDIRDRMWTNHVAAARVYAADKKYDLARAELDAAAAMPTPPDAVGYMIPVRRALLELKAGRKQLAAELIDQAKRMTPAQAPVLLMLSIEAIRYRLPKRFSADFELEWLSLLKRRSTSEAAGEMSAIMKAFLASDVRYPRRDWHAEQVLDYVRRSARVKWKPQDLREVCGFLHAARNSGEVDEVEAHEVFTARLDKGVRQFPQEPYFLITAGREEIDKGPYDCDRRLAHDYLERGLALAERSGNPGDAQLVEPAKRGLSFLDEAGEGRPPSLSFLGEDDEDEYDEDVFDEIDEDDFVQSASRLMGLPIDAIPSFLRGMIEQMGEALGVTPEEIVHRVATSKSPREVAEKLGVSDFSESGPPRNTKKTRKAKRK